MTGEELKALEGLVSEPLCDDRAPLTSPVTLQMAFALAVGYPFFSSESFLDAIEELPDGTIKRQVTWAFNGESTVEFNGEHWTVRMFIERLTDPKWRGVRRKHPVAKLGKAYAAAAELKASERAIQLAHLATKESGWLAEMITSAKKIYLGYRWKIQAGLDGETEPHPEYQKPLGRMIVYRKENSRAYIREHATAEEREAELKRYGMA